MPTQAIRSIALQLAAAIAFAFLLTGCGALGRSKSSSTPPSDPALPPITTASIAANPQDAGKQPPVTVEISQAFVDKGGKLHVAVKLQVKDRLPANQVQVSLIGLKDGEVLREKRSLVSEVLEKETLRSGDVAQLLFEMELADLTEYQVACRWGDEVKRTPPDIPKTGIVEINNSPIRQTGLSLTVLKQEIEKIAASCATSSCGHYFSVTLTVLNNTPKAIVAPQLGVSILWVNEGEALPGPPSTSQPVPDEEVVTLEQVTLAPGKTETFRVKVDRSVPEVAGGEFRPRLRFIEHP